MDCEGPTSPLTQSSTHHNLVLVKKWLRSSLRSLIPSPSNASTLKATVHLLHNTVCHPPTGAMLRRQSEVIHFTWKWFSERQPMIMNLLHRSSLLRDQQIDHKMNEPRQTVGKQSKVRTGLWFLSQWEQTQLLSQRVCFGFRSLQWLLIIVACLGRVTSRREKET